MKEFLSVLATGILVLAVFIAGYYLGIFMAILGAIFTVIGIVGAILFILSYMAWEAIQSWKGK